MADEIMEAIQMLRFGYDGIKLGLDVTGSSIREAKNLTIFIVGLLNHEKTQGKTSLKKMLKNSGNLQVLQIKEKAVRSRTYGIFRRQGRKSMGYSATLQHDSRQNYK